MGGAGAPIIMGAPPSAMPAGGGMQVMTVTAPAGARPGQMITIAGPGGAPMQVQCPVHGGQSFQFQAAAPNSAAYAQPVVAQPVGPPVVMAMPVG